MIPNQWYVVMDSTQVKDVPVGVTRMGEKLVFWRDGSGAVSCLRDRCVHRGVQLSAGKILDDHLQCPFHGFEYTPSGRVVKIPATGKNAPVPDRFCVHNYPTYEDHGFIWIWWGEDPPESLNPPRFLDGIDDSFSYGKAHDPWDAHYSRVIENQLDVVHLPFVHHNTIGRGGRTLVDGPVVRWADEDMFNVYAECTCSSSFPICGRTTSRRMCGSWPRLCRWIQSIRCCIYDSISGSFVYRCSRIWSTGYRCPPILLSRTRIDEWCRLSCPSHLPSRVMSS